MIIVFFPSPFSFALAKQASQHKEGTHNQPVLSFGRGQGSTPALPLTTAAAVAAAERLMLLWADLIFKAFTNKYCRPHILPCHPLGTAARLPELMGASRPDLTRQARSNLHTETSVRFRVDSVSN